MSEGCLLEDLTWLEAEEALSGETVVVIPLGAASKEHGPHLKLKNDFVMAQYLKDELLKRCQVAIMPTINYHYYPAFIEYPGSVSLSEETATNIVVEICRSVASFGPRRFYVLNTGISTLPPLKAASVVLASEGLLLRFTDLNQAIKATVTEISEQEGGSHADEIETSIMLFIAPTLVEMDKAVKDFDGKGKGRLSRQSDSGFTFSPTGVFGDPTLATAQKGQRVVKSLLSSIVSDIEDLRTSAIPSGAVS